MKRDAITDPDGKMIWRFLTPPRRRGLLGDLGALFRRELFILAFAPRRPRATAAGFFRFAIKDMLSGQQGRRKGLFTNPWLCAFLKRDPPFGATRKRNAKQRDPNLAGLVGRACF